jgi:hypothetical protein
MNLIKTSLIAAAVLLVTVSTAPAQNGPVAGACATEIEKYCKGLPHVNRAVRNCLEENKEKASPACREVLDTTGPGRGGGYGRGGNGN